MAEKKQKVKSKKVRAKSVDKGVSKKTGVGVKEDVKECSVSTPVRESKVKKETLKKSEERQRGKVAEGKSGKAESRKIPKKKSESNKTPKTMEELLEVMDYELKAPKRGEVIEGVVTEVTKRMVLVDIGAKTEGMVIEKEFEATKELIGDLKVGDEVSVYVSQPENDRGQILLSLKRAAIDRKWEQFAEYLETGEVVEVTGLEVNRGGLIVSMEGMRGFVPSSQFGKKYLGNMDELLNETFEVKVIEVDREKNRLIFSERFVSEAEAIDKKDKALKVIKVGDTYEGVVSGIMPFGVFMTVTVPLEGVKGKVKSGKQKKGDDTVGQVEGLVHISEISWEKVNDPNDYFKQGDRVKVKVLGVDNGKLNLSVKQMSDDPWTTITKKYPEGKQVKGKVTRAAPFGMFVTLEPGVDGLIHISKIPAGSEPNVGDEIDVVVDSVDSEQRRMSLGMMLKEVPVMYR